MPWKTMEVREQRVEFVVRALRGAEPLSQLCSEFGVSRPTGYKWLARYREGGVAAIEERSRRPHESPARTGAELETQVVALRKKYPDWGAQAGRAVGPPGHRASVVDDSSCAFAPRFGARC